MEYNGIEKNGVAVIQSIFRGLINSNWDTIFTLQKGGIPQLMLETVMIGFLGTLLGMIISIPISFYLRETLS